MDLSRCGVRETIKKFNLTVSIKDRTRSGRPQKLSLRDKRQLIILSKKDPKMTARQLLVELNLGQEVSVNTIKKVSNENGLIGRISAKKPSVNKAQRIRCL